MNKKKFMMAIFIISLLAVAFFWGGGNKEVVPLSHDEISEGIEKVYNNENTLDVNKDNEEKKSLSEDLVNELEKNLNMEIEQLEKITKLEEDKQKEITEKNNKEDNTLEKEIENEKPIDLKLEKERIIAEDNKRKDKKDKYLTDPVPEGKPKPVEWQDVTINKDKELTCTLSVTCKTILNNMHLFNMDKIDVLPEDGIIYETQKVTFYEGESVFDVLLREMRKNKIHMEFAMTPIYNSNYVEGINNLYEFDCGELSGWMYRVNGWFPNYGSSRYMVQDGDVIEWIYTCDLGRDIGGEWAVIGGIE